MIVVLAVPLQIPFVLFIPWDDMNLTHAAFVPVGALDYALIYGGFKLCEWIMKPRAPGPPN